MPLYLRTLFLSLTRTLYLTLSPFLSFHLPFSPSIPLTLSFTLSVSLLSLSRYLSLYLSLSLTLPPSLSLSLFTYLRLSLSLFCRSSLFSGLEEQLLGLVVGEELPELSEQKTNLVTENARMNKQLYDIESEILRLLSNSTGRSLTTHFIRISFESN